MKKNFVDDSRGGMIIFLGVLLAALWMLIAHGAYEESKREKYDGSVHPGAVSSGTRNATPAPTVSMPTYRSHTPMVSGAAVRSYAYSGHATMPTAASGSGFTVRTTSSATLHSYGSGGGGGGGFSGGGSSSSRGGITYGGGTVSMPALAMATPSRRSRSEAGLMAEMASSTSDQVAAAGPALRRVLPNGNGEYNGEYYNGQWWNEDEEEWVDDPFEGAVKNEGGIMYRYEGGEWVPIENQADPNAPVGDVPWIILLMLVAVYAFAKKRTSKTCDK